MEVNKPHLKENCWESFPINGSITSEDFFKELIGKDPGELADKHKFLFKNKWCLERKSH